MANSALSTPIAQQLAGNIKNQDGSPAIYSAGTWTFENSSGTTTFTVSDAGAVTAGPAGLTGDVLSINSGSTSSVKLGESSGVVRLGRDANSLYLSLNASSYDGGNYVESKRSAQMHFDCSASAATTGAIRFKTATSGTAGNAISYIDVGSVTDAGAWTLGPSSGTTNTQHTMWQYGNGVSVVCEFKRVAADASTIKFTGSTNNIQIGHSGGQGYFEGISGKNAGAGAPTVYCSTGNLLGTTATSDERLKTNIRDIGPTLQGLSTLRTARFDWKDGSGTDAIGFIAQDLKKTFPEFVHQHEDGLLAIQNINSFEVVLVKAIQEQQAMIEALQAKVAALEAK